MANRLRIILNDSKSTLARTIDRAKNYQFVLGSRVIGTIRAASFAQRLAAVSILLFVASACKDDSLSNLLNGNSANASSDRTPYIPGATATQAEINRLQNYAPGQSTGAMHDVLGSPDSTTPGADYYYSPDGQSMVVVPYNAAGNWTGKIESVPAPQWQPSPYPGAQ